MANDDLSARPASQDSVEALLRRVVAAPVVLPPGTRLAHYEIERVLGAGGMGTVYLAYDPKLDRHVAIKLHHTLDAEHLRSEAVAMARLAHPNVVTVYEIGERDGHPFVVMEYVPGETLRGWLARAPRTRAEILRVLHAVGDGLAAAHAAGLVHRDVKPDNVLVGADGRARIGDFGLARSGDAIAGVAGTPAYMAPEQKAGGVVDARADQYALAVLAREALTTAPSPNAKPPAAVARAALATTVSPNVNLPATVVVVGPPNPRDALAATAAPPATRPPATGAAAALAATAAAPAARPPTTAAAAGSSNPRDALAATGVVPATRPPTTAAAASSSNPRDALAATGVVPATRPPTTDAAAGSSNVRDALAATATSAAGAAAGAPNARDALAATAAVPATRPSTSDAAAGSSNPRDALAATAVSPAAELPGTNAAGAPNARDALAATAVSPAAEPRATDAAAGAPNARDALAATAAPPAGEPRATDAAAGAPNARAALAATAAPPAAQPPAAVTRAVPMAPAASSAKLPAALARVIDRGCADDPAKRYPTVRAFLDALAAAERRPRRIAVATMAATALAAAVAVAAVVAWPADVPEQACDDVVSELDRVLPARATDALVASVRALPAPHAAQSARVIEQAFARHRREHAAHARRACRARVTKQWASELVAASDDCLAFQARTAGELARAMTTSLSPATLVDVVQLSARLPALAACTDPRILAGQPALVAEPAQRDAAIAARARLAVAALHVELGQLARARAIVDAIEGEPVHALPDIRLRHDLVAGLLAIASTEHAAGEQQLEAAYFTARARDDGEALLVAVGALVRATAIVRRDHAEGARWIANAIADAEREQARHPQAAMDVRLATAAAAVDAGDTEVAQRRLAAAEASLDAHSSTLQHATLLFTRADVLGNLGRWDEAIAVHDALLQILRYTFGASHPIVGQVQADRASSLREAGRTDAAALALREAIAIANDQVTAGGPSLAATEIAIGSTLLSIDDPTGATYLERARGRLVAAFGEQHPDVALIDTNLALVYLDRGELDRALGTMRRAVAALEARLGRHHLELAAALYNLAVMEREAGDLAAARATATRCAEIHAQKQPGSPRHIYALVHVAMIDNLDGRPAQAIANAEAALRALPSEPEPMGAAWARLELAKALLALRRDPARVRRELVEARAGYVRANLPARVKEIDALLAQPR